MVSNAKKTALSNNMNTIVVALVGVIVNPMLLNALGAATFGTWKAIQRFLVLGNTANGGAMESLKWVIAHRTKNTTDDEKRRDVAAALTVMLYWSPVLLATTAVIIIALPVLMRDVPSGDMPMVYLTGAILGVNIILVNLASIPNSVLVGVKQGFRSMNITTAAFVITNAVMVVAAIRGFGPVGMAVAMTIGTTINGFLTYLVLRKNVTWWGFAKPTRDDIRRVSGFSGWVFAWSFVIRVSLATEVIVLSAFAGVTYVSSYTFTSYVVVFALSVSVLTNTSLMPKLGSFVGNGEWHNAQAAAAEARELTLALAVGMGSMTILLNESFVRVWAGSGQFMGQGVNVLMVIAFVQFAVIRTEAQIQDTSLDIRNKVLAGAGMTVAAIVAGGVVYTLSRSVEAMYFAIIAARAAGSVGFPILANRVTHGGGWPIGRSVIAVVVLGICIGIANFVHARNLFELVMYGVAAGLVVAPVVYFAMLSKGTRRKILSR